MQKVSMLYRLLISRKANTKVYQRKSPDRERIQEERRIQLESKPLEKFMTRDWKAGDVYSPHDLSPTEMKKWRKRQSPPTDAFDALKKNPLDLYKVSLSTYDDPWHQDGDADMREKGNLRLTGMK